MDKDLVLAIDLGGTRIRAAVVDADGKIIERKAQPTLAEEGRESVIGRLVNAASEVLQQSGPERILAVGIGAPGPLDSRAGVIAKAPNLPGWYDVPLRDIMQSALGLPVLLGNDANLAALGELTYGVGQGVRNLVYITVSTGIGGGVVVDGELLLGERGLAAEVGHMTVDAFGPVCGCGNRGCLESLASGTAIARQARERVDAGAETLIQALVGADGEITAEMVEEAARAGDGLAKDLMESAATYLGIGVVSLLHLFNPKMVIIGGGVSNAGDLLFLPLNRVIAERAMPPYRTGLVITSSSLGDDVGLLGAAALARSLQ